MTRKLTPQEHLENIIIQQNSSRPVNQYTELLWNEGTAGFARPNKIVDYGELESFEKDATLVQVLVLLSLILVAPLSIIAWIFFDWIATNLVGCRNNKSAIRAYRDDEPLADAIGVAIGATLIPHPILILVIFGITSLFGGSLTFWGIFLALNLIGLAVVAILAVIDAWMSVKYLATLNQG